MKFIFSEKLKTFCLSYLLFFLPTLLQNIVSCLINEETEICWDQASFYPDCKQGLNPYFLTSLFPEKKKPHLSCYYPYFLTLVILSVCFIQRREFFIFCWAHFWCSVSTTIYWVPNTRQPHCTGIIAGTKQTKFLPLLWCLSSGEAGRQSATKQRNR